MTPKIKTRIVMKTTYIKTKWFVSHSPSKAKFINKSFKLGRWHKSIKNQPGIGGTIIANAYGDTKEEAETIASLIVNTHNNSLAATN